MNITAQCGEKAGYLECGGLVWCLELPIRDGRDFITVEFAEPASVGGVVSYLIANTCRVWNHEIS